MKSKTTIKQSWRSVYPNELMRKDMYDLGIYVSDRPGEKYHVLSKEAERKAPRARAEMLSAIKKYPSIVREIKWRNEKTDFFNNELTDEEKDEISDEQFHKFEYTHKAWVRPESIASNVRFGTGAGLVKDDDTIQSMEKMQSLEPFKKRFGELSYDLGKQFVESRKPSPLSPKQFQMFDKTTDAIVRLGIMVSSKKDVNNFMEEWQKNEEQFSADPHMYRGPYSGNKSSPYFTTIIGNGTCAFEILLALKNRESGQHVDFDKNNILPMEYPAKWQQIKNASPKIYSDDMAFGRVLKGLVNAGMVYKHANKEGYTITDLGKGVIQEVTQYGEWKSAKYVPQREWKPQEEHTAYRPYKKIESGSVAHHVLYAIASGEQERAHYHNREGTGPYRWQRDWETMYDLTFHEQGIPVRKGHLPVSENDSQVRKLENTGLIYRVKVGWYKITPRAGLGALATLSEGHDWHNKNYEKQLESEIPPYAKFSQVRQKKRQVEKWYVAVKKDDYTNFFERGSDRALRVELISGQWQVIDGTQSHAIGVTDTAMYPNRVLYRGDKEDVMNYAREYMTGRTSLKCENCGDIVDKVFPVEFMGHTMYVCQGCLESLE